MKLFQLTNTLLLFLGAANGDPAAVDNLRLDDVLSEKFCGAEGQWCECPSGNNIIYGEGDLTPVPAKFLGVDACTSEKPCNVSCSS